jgi:hypothetical protein
MNKLKTLSRCFGTVYPSHGPFPLAADVIASCLKARRASRRPDRAAGAAV